jgi:regulator of nucleoside diphosphate kinase
MMTLADDVIDRPCIFVCRTDLERLERLLPEVTVARAEASTLLSEELDRAEICDPADMPARVVRLGSRVRFRDLDSGRERTVRLVTPVEADAADGRISILTPIGAALLGLPEEQLFSWRAAGGGVRSIQVLEVLDDFVFR